MRLILLLLTTTLIPSSTDQSHFASAGQQEPPGAEVLGFDFGQKMQLPPQLDKDGRYVRGQPPYPGWRMSGDRERDTTRYANQVGIGTGSMEASGGSDPYSEYPSSLPTGSSFPTPETSSSATVVVRNTGSKTIKAIDWDFPFPHISEKRPVLRYAMRSKAIIKPAEIKTIREPISPSARGFNVIRGNGPERTVTLMSIQEGISVTVPIDCLSQGAQIIRIKYSDGSVWQRR
jgi:hypothetical protein